MNRTRAARLCAAWAVAGLVIIPAVPAAAAQVPFNDPSAHGAIGFCDSHGSQIRSGRVDARPFVPLVVSSVAAPAGYGAPRGKATLVAYQPRRGVDPMDWSGKQMTAASQYTSTGHPMSEATSLDPALVDFVSVFPPNWDGMVQLRLWFTAANAPQHLDPYPAAVVKVAGNRWTQVGGADVPCTAGKATSFEKVALPASRFAAGANGTAAAPGHSSGSAYSSRTAAPGATTSGRSTGAASPTPHGTTTTSAAPVAAPADQAAKAHSSASSLPMLLLGGGLVLVVAAGVAGYLRRRAHAR